jgi:hypothetical protein
MPECLKTLIDGVLSPMTMFVGWLVVLTALYLGRRWFVRPGVAAALIAAAFLFLGLSLCDPHFAAVALMPDNVPIMAMLFLLSFFTWLATAQAVETDRRLERGEPPVEKAVDGKALVWPDLIYRELICATAVATALVAWSLLVPAPLEQPADPTVTPNPSKAPWYFLGLQEMLSYGDVRLLGAIVPCLAVLGLLAVPYLDSNRKGSGYYTIRRRRCVFLAFQFCFWMLWILPIVIGTFFRGPNWNFIGLYSR